jgi:hypothetical protein
MTNETIRISPPNSQLFISDKNGGVVPDFLPHPAVLSTPSGITFICFPEQDGPTEITLGAVSEVHPGTPPTFEGSLETPSRAIIVSTVEWKKVLEAEVPQATTHVRIWLNHPKWPDKVIIGLG